MEDVGLPTSSRIHVVAGVIRDELGRVLLAQRSAGKEHAGLWEFPGGKVESTEDARKALIRELNEELGVSAGIGGRLIAVPDGRIVLDVYRVLDYQGVVRARESQKLAWIALADIDATRLPPADRPVLAALRLPDHYLITPTLNGADEPGFLSAIDRSLAAGIRMIQLRLPDYSREQLAPLARQVRERCRHAGALLMLNTDWQLAELLGLDGVHLPAQIAQTLSSRPVPKHRWLGVSCHDAGELEHAAAIGADFATLSPIHYTPGHTHSQPLGWQRAEALIAESSIPVYALGGMQHSELATAHASGAQGIAAVRALWPD